MAKIKKWANTGINVVLKLWTAATWNSCHWRG